MFFISIFEKILLLLGVCVCAFSSLHSKNITDCFRIIAQENLCFLRVSKYFSCVWERHSKLFYFTFWSKPLFSSQNFFAWTSDFLFLGDFYLYPLKSPYVLRWRLLFTFTTSLIDVDTFFVILNRSIIISEFIKEISYWCLLFSLSELNSSRITTFFLNVFMFLRDFLS